MRLGEGLATTRLRAGIRKASSILSEATLTRSSAAWAWGSDQLLDEYAANELRRDYDPADGTFRGVLVEESRTNKWLHSRKLSDAQWGKDFVTVTEDAASSPSGITDADKVVVTADNDLHRIKQSASINSGLDVTTSFFVKPDEFLEIKTITEANVSFDYDAGADSFSNIGTDVKDYGSMFVGNGWYKVYLSWTTPNADPLIQINLLNNNGDRIYAGDGSSGLYLWQVQIEEAALYPTSPIETENSTFTRAADVLEGSFSKSTGTIHIVGEHKGGDGVLWQADDTTTNKRLRLEVSSGNVQLVVDDGGTNQATLNAGALASDGTYNVAFRFDASDFAVSLDGATAVTQSSGTVPTVTTQRFGRDTSATTGINWYKTADYRSSKLTDSELETLTA